MKIANGKQAVKGEKTNCRPANAPGGRKADELERDRRREECFKLMFRKGKSRFEVHKHFKDKYQLCWGTTDKIYIAHAYRMAQDLSGMTRQQAMSLCVSKLVDTVYNGPPQASNRSIELLMKVFGLADPTRIELTGANGGPVSTLDETPVVPMSKERLLELLQAAAASSNGHSEKQEAR